jgi:hypothetical protein
MTIYRKIAIITYAGALVWLCAFLAGNRRSLAEGLRYLIHMRTWRPDNIQPIARDGPFGVCYELVGMGNAARCEKIAEELRRLGLEPTQISVPGDPLPNLFVRFGSAGPLTLFVAHYDKSRETPTYQGASDNTAAVCVLLAAARAFAAHPPDRSIGLLFTAAEERGFLGARAFCAWAQTENVAIAEVINCDMLGRGRIAVRPSALPGFYFQIPGVGAFVYDGRRIARGAAYQQPAPALIRWLQAALGNDLVIYRRFTAHSDSNVFQEAGLPTVSLSSDDMYYLDLIWDRDSDRIELLDERHLALALRVVIGD